jgi:hypothetical protein
MAGISLLLVPTYGQDRIAGNPPTANSRDGETLRVGTAAVEITPPIGWRMAGGFEERINTGTHDPLSAKAMVFAQGNIEAALVICDVCSVGRELTDPARERASRKTGIPVGRIAICATHTHAGPEYYGTLRNLFHEQARREHGRDPHEPIDYPAKWIDSCVEAVVQARGDLRPVAAGVGLARQPGLAHNRRYLMKDGTVQFNPPKNSRDIVRAAGPVDEDFPILLFRDVKTGQPRAALSVFALHVATFGGTTYSADYPGRLQVRLGEPFGPRFFSLFGQGTAGDINHFRFLSDEPNPTTVQIGDALARTFLDSVPELQPIEHPSLAARSIIVKLPLQELTEEAVARAHAVLERKWVAEPAFLVMVEAWKILNTQRLRQRDGDALNDEVQAIRISDDTAIVTLPHEVFVELGLAIKRRSPFRRTFVISMANDLDFYVPTRRAFAEGSYEVVTSSVKPGGGERLVEGALQVLRQLKER